MQNFCKQSAIGCVANVFSFVTTGRHIVFLFNPVQYLDQTLEKAVNSLRNIFHPFLYNLLQFRWTFSLNIFNVFTMERIKLQMR